MAQAVSDGYKPVRINTRDKINVKLTTPEIADRAIQSCKISAELEKVELEFAAIKAEWKKKISVVQEKYNTLRRAVQSGEEFREVDCQRAYDLQRGITWLEFEGKIYGEHSASQKELELLQAGDMEDFMGNDSEEDDDGSEEGEAF